MHKLTATDPETKSADIVAENIERLKELFPEAFTEGKIDFDVLKQVLGGAVDEREEKYGLNWHGKRAARRLALTPSTGTLRPCPEDGVDWDTTQNIMIEGDNLEVLKLLQKSYAGKVKMIYIDPPYNTGNDFVYPDDFKDNIKNYLEITGQVDGGQRLSTNTEASGRFHASWLCMMLPRLKLARNLLKPDGAIFVSCDEGEQAHLRLAMNEVFGQENFVADMIWAAGRKNDSRLISISHEYIVCYSRDSSYLTEQKVEWRQRKKGLEEIYSQFEKVNRKFGPDYAGATSAMKEWFKSLADSHPAKAHKHYSNVDFRGLYFPDNISWPGGGGPKFEILHPRTGKPVAVPSRGWMTSDPEKLKKWIADERVHFGVDEAAVPCIKSYLKDREYQAPYSVFYQDGRAATKRLRELMAGDCFDFPKDELVLQDLVAMMTTEQDIIVDFFAGSGTAGHAVMAQNASDSMSRRYILIQLPEPLSSDENKQKLSADYCAKLGKPLNIAELTKERLRRAGRKIREENPTFHGDLGFRVFKLDSSNIRAWDPDRDNLAESLTEHVTNLKDGRTEQDLLFEVLLKQRGLELTVPMESRMVDCGVRAEGEQQQGHHVHAIGGGALIVCLSTSIALEEVEPLANAIIAWHKELAPASDTNLVFRDSAFADDVAKTNLTAILEQHGLGNVKSI